MIFLLIFGKLSYFFFWLVELFMLNCICGIPICMRGSDLMTCFFLEVSEVLMNLGLGEEASPQFA